MPNLSQKLAQLRQAENVRVKEEEIATLTLDEMEKEIIEFGKNKGKTLAEAFQDDGWVTYMVGRQDKLTSPEHKKFYRYLELKVEKQLQEAGITTEKKTSEGCRIDKRTGPPKSAAKATASQDDSWDIGAEMVMPVENDGPLFEIFDKIDLMQKEIQHLHHWMERQQQEVNYVVHHLKQVIDHIKTTTSHNPIKEEFQ